jgi:uncharacterized protein with FMN-binding domain
MGKRLAVLLAGTAAVVALIVTVRPHQPAPPRRPAAIESAPPSAALPSLSTPVAPSSTPPPHYRAGTRTGARVHTDYGYVRVRVTTAHGRIVHVVALELPRMNPVDTQLSKPAARTLAHEVVRAQTADVDAVSGATYTSEGYLTSLQSALDRLS